MGVFDSVSHALGTDGGNGGLLGIVSHGVQSIGSLGAEFDKGVRQVVPGGWATLGVAALAVMAPYLAPYLAEAATAGEGLGAAAEIGAGAGTSTAGVGLGAGSATGIAGTQAAAGLGLGTGATGVGVGTGVGLTGAGTAAGITGTQLAAGLGAGAVGSTLLGSAGTGALTGGTMGGVNSAIRGTDPIKGILTGALMGGLTGASLSGINDTLAQYGVNNPALSSAILSTAKGLASGANPVDMLGSTALNTGLSFLGSQANQYVPSVLTSAGTGAIGSAVKGGDPLMGAASGAAGNLFGSATGALKSAYNNLTAPTTSAAAPVYDYSTPYNGQSVQLGDSNLNVQYLTDASKKYGDELTGLYPELSKQQAALADVASKTNEAYTQAQADKTAFTKALEDSGYQSAYKNAEDLRFQASQAYNQLLPYYTTYTENKAIAEDTSRSLEERYQATLTANGVADQLTTLIPKYNDLSSQFETANTNLTDLYTKQIEPLYTAYQNSNSSLQDLTSNYKTQESQVASLADTVSKDITGLSQISLGQLPTGYMAETKQLAAPTATEYAPLASGTTSDVPTPLVPSDTKGLTPEQAAFTSPYILRPDGTLFLDANGSPIPNPLAQQATTDTGVTGSSGGDTGTSGTVTVTADRSTGLPSMDELNAGLANGDITPDQYDQYKAEIDKQNLINNVIADQSGAISSPSSSGGTGTTGLGTGAGTTGTGTGALPTQTTNTDTTAPTSTQTGTTGGTATTGGLPTTSTGAGTTGGLPTTATGAGTIGTTGAGAGTTDTTGTGAGTTGTTGAGAGTTSTTGAGAGTTDTASTTSSTDGSGTAGTGTGTGTGTGAGTTAGTGTGAGTSSGTGAGLTAAGLAAALAGLGGSGSSSGSGLSSVASATPAAPKGTFVKGTQIASPLGSFNVPNVAYSAPAADPNSLQEIENAATGGIMHLADGGSANEDDLSLKPVLMRGKQTQHANLFGSGTIPLYSIPGHADGGSIPQGFNPQFYSEGGLGSMQNSFVQGPGTGTSDSIPAMLSNGEFVIPADVVSSLGDGSNDSGAKVLDSFLTTIRAHKQKHDAKHLPAKSKGALGYLLEAKRKVKK